MLITSPLLSLFHHSLRSTEFAVEHGAMGVKFPLTPGHEVVGRIVQRGSGVSDDFKEGLLVGLGWNGGYCQQCEACRKGEFYGCANGLVTGFHTGGGHQEYLTARWEAVVKLPEDSGLSPAEMAPLLCAGITVNDGLNATGAKPGDVVIVQGLGGLGHLGIQFARKAGYHVVAMSGGDSKKELALKLGAHDFFNAKQGEEFKKKYGGAKGAVATAPSSAAISSLLPLLARNGVMTVVGIPPDGKNLEFAPMQLVSNRCTVKGITCGCSINNEELVKFAALGDNQVKSMVNIKKLDDADAVYKDTAQGNPRFRNVFVFDE